MRFRAGALVAVFVFAWPQISSNASAQDSAGSSCGPVPLPAGGLITRERVLRFSPRARSDLVDAVVEGAALEAAGGINSPLRLQHFIAEVATETGGLTSISENLNYSEKRLLAVFPRRVSAARAKVIAGRPFDIAKEVYGGEWGLANLGNRLGTNDFWDYRGSGYLQLTGRSNFVSRGNQINVNIAADPATVRDAKLGLKTAISFWAAVEANVPADRNDLKGVRKRINGGTNGMRDATIWLARARQYFPAPNVPIAAGAFDPEVAAAVIGRVSEAGIAVTASAIPNADDLRNAILSYQDQNGLAPTGLLDDDTLYALTDPADIVQDETGP